MKLTIWDAQKLSDPPGKKEWSFEPVIVCGEFTITAVDAKTGRWICSLWSVNYNGLYLCPKAYYILRDEGYDTDCLPFDEEGRVRINNIQGE